LWLPFYSARRHERGLRHIDNLEFRARMRLYPTTGAAQTCEGPVAPAAPAQLPSDGKSMLEKWFEEFEAPARRARAPHPVPAPASTPVQPAPIEHVSLADLLAKFWEPPRVRAPRPVPARKHAMTIDEWRAKVAESSAPPPSQQQHAGAAGVKLEPEESGTALLSNRAGNAPLAASQGDAILKGEM